MLFAAGRDGDAERRRERAENVPRLAVAHDGDLQGRR